MKPLELDYFYGNDAEQFTFYRIPKVLFTAAHYRAVPVEAKVLYGLLLDRMALSARNDVIYASGRSDTPNQVNNLLCFPYMFRGALDVRARRINEQMKIAAAYALANLAREEVPQQVRSLLGRDDLAFGPDYIIPSPFDPRLRQIIPAAVAKAAIESGAAPKPE